MVGCCYVTERRNTGKGAGVGGKMAVRFGRVEFEVWVIWADLPSRQ